DGYELVQQLRQDADLRGIRVIFFSAVYAERETKALAARSGVATVLPKPADPQQILDAINTELGMLEGAAPLPLPEPETERERALPFDLGARLAELERMCLALIGERRVETLAASFLDAARRVLHADYAALCLLDRGERSVRHLDTWSLAPELLA